MLDAIRRSLAALKTPLQDQIIVAAVSGGADSLVLMHVLHQLQATFGYQLHIATFDHGLRGEDSASDAQFVWGLAESWGLGVSMGGRPVASLADASRLNMEAAARQARYTFLLETAGRLGASFIAVGHHQDDQAETVLMHIVRGAGLGGLQGMLPDGQLTESHLLNDAPEELWDLLEDVHLLRPLLDVSRAEIDAYAAEHNLHPRHDTTNDDTQYLRNRLRHEVLPMLQAVNPHIREALARLATIVQGDYEIIQNAVLRSSAELVDWGETDAGEIAYVDRRDFLALSVGLQRQMLRHICFDLTPDLRDFAFEQIEAARQFIANGETWQQQSLPADMTLMLGYDEFMIYYGGDLPFPRHIPALSKGQVVPLGVISDQVIEQMRFYTYWVVDNRSQELVRDDPLEATLSIPPDAEIELRTRKAGDRFTPFGMMGRSQKISDTFTNMKIPRPLRDRVPLLTVNGEIAWFVAPTAAGLQGRISHQFAVNDQSESVLRVRWQELDPEQAS